MSHSSDRRSNTILLIVTVLLILTIVIGVVAFLNCKCKGSVASDPVDDQCKWSIKDDDAIRSTISSNHDITYLILFYADWCVHCHVVKPMFLEVVDSIKAKSKLNGVDLRIKLVNLNDTNESIITRYDLNAIPQITKVFYDDEHSLPQVKVVHFDNSTNDSESLDEQLTSFVSRQ